MAIHSYKMPRTVIDFSNTVMYKLVCNDVEIKDIYVGHTTNFTKRKYNHHTAYYNPNHTNHNCYVYEFIRSNGGFDNWSMIEIEKYPCFDGNEACKRERYWLETLKATLNKRIPNAVNSIGKEAYFKQYRDLNKSKIRQQQSIKNTCECGGCFTYGDRSKHFKTSKHQNYINSSHEYEYQWLDGTPCTAQEYYDSLN